VHAAYYWNHTAGGQRRGNPSSRKGGGIVQAGNAFYQQGSTLGIEEEPVDESGEGLERTRHGASCPASSEREDEPGKSLSGPPGSLLPELPQVTSLNRARTCRGGEALALALMPVPVLCRHALRSSGGASACNGMQNGDQNTGTN